MSFDADSGQSLVQTEAAVTAEIESAALQRAGAIKRIADAYADLKDRMNGEGKLADFFAIEERMEPLRIAPTTAAEQVVYDFYDVQKRETRLRQAASVTNSKYGKFRYVANGGRAQIYRQYGAHHGRAELLWEGGL